MGIKQGKIALLLLAGGMLAACGSTTNASSSTSTSGQPSPASSQSESSVSSVSSQAVSSPSSSESKQSVASSSEASEQSSVSSSEDTQESSSISSQEESEETSKSSASSSESSVSSVESTEVSSASSVASSTSSEQASADFTIIRTADSSVPSYSQGAYTISEGGEYDLAGTFKGMIYIDVAETTDNTGEVVLNFNGVTLSNDENSVIYCVSADKLEISAKKGTVNSITDLRPIATEDDPDQGGGVIYSKVDTKLKGTGTLNVTGTYNNGVHVTKDLEIQKLTLTSTAVNNAIKGNDSLTINSGTITAISSGGDGLKTEDSDISSKLKQRGDITILGGTVDIYSACDGAQAAHDFILGSETDDTTFPTVTIHTNKYSSYTNEGDIVSSSTAKMYLRTTSYSNSYRYSCYFYGDAGSEGTWADAAYLTSKQSGGGRGGRTTYYYYEVERPSSLNSFTIYAFNASDTVNSTTNYVAKSSGQTVNSNYDTVTFSRSSSTISTSGWSNYASTQGGGGWPGGGGGWGGEGNTDKADVSAKGIKAQNDIYILSGTLDITAYDDGIHANNGETLDSGATSTGDVYIKGGTTKVSASDDGVHADRILNISGGELTVTTSYEGLEGNQINISGGKSVVYASDDAVNAGSGTLTSKITVSDGYLFAAVPSSGDTDGIDSNGAYTQTGGTVIACGPGSSMSAAMDTDGTVSVNSGSLILFGGSEKTPSLGSGVTRSSKSGTYRNQAYTLTFNNSGTTTQVVTATLPNYSYSQCNCYSVLGSLTSIA